jgi:hypothetical protein
LRKSFNEAIAIHSIIGLTVLAISFRAAWIVAKYRASPLEGGEAYDLVPKLPHDRTESSLICEAKQFREGNSKEQVSGRFV